MAQDWLHIGLAKRDLQDMEGALEALAHGITQAPDHAVTAFAHAQVLFETGRPATAAFAHAFGLDPDNPALIKTYAAALAAEGEQGRGESLLLDTLARHPLWLDGHKALATLRVSAGRRAIFDESFTRAIAHLPGHVGLRLAHIHLLCTARDWESARVQLNAAKIACGSGRGLILAELFIESEAGDARGDDPNLFDGVRDVVDAGLDLARVRHALRLGDPKRAADCAETYINKAEARLFWPYLGLAWQVLCDSRADWLSGLPYVKTHDLGLSARELAALAGELRNLHKAQAPYLEQSVHGGTQTDRQLFFRPLPQIQALRSKVQAAVQIYIDDLGPMDTNHPLLGVRRDGPHLFEGSWSVLLQGGGAHSVHTHPKGWISSALHVEVPPSVAGEVACPVTNTHSVSCADSSPVGRGSTGDQSGWLCFGQAPPELKLGDLTGRAIQPKAGTLVLFPSYLWHHTQPFSDGQRLSVAFDIALPQ
ncbi:MAG: hypothetical protein RLZZ157_612 [Pseudomonadota bacterium]|jgi:Tfp pilus assembly protein PilF